MTARELHDRILHFTSAVLTQFETLPANYAQMVLVKQLIRACTSVALNYAEAISSQSARDFSHKLSLCLKELRECHAALRLLQPISGQSSDKLDDIVDECDQLIRIFVSSIKTHSQNQRNS